MTQALLAITSQSKMNLAGRGGFQDRKQDINKKGRPPSFNQIHRVALKIANEKVQTEDGGKMLRVESILRELAESKDVQARKLFLEYSHGKPADRIELDELQPHPTLILHWAHEMPGYVPPDKGANYRFREASRMALRMAKELADPRYLTPTSARSRDFTSRTTPLHRSKRGLNASGVLVFFTYKTYIQQGMTMLCKTQAFLCAGVMRRL